jgi:hypothetical protein
MSWSHAEIVDRLEQIERGFAEQESKGEKAAADFFTTKRAFEEQYALTYMATEGQATERKQATLLSLMRHPAYKAHVVAEAAYEAHRAAMRTLEARSMIGMALLKASSREAPQSGPQPAWSRGGPVGARGVAV